VFKTTDNWATSPQWQFPFQNESAPFPGAVLAMDPANPQVLYAGYQNIARTANGGTGWQQLTNYTDGADCVAISVAPSNPQTIYASRSFLFAGMTLRSSDGGATWTDVSDGLADLPVSDFAVHPSNPNRVWVALDGDPGSVVFSSNNGGATWTNYSGTLPQSTANTIVYDNGSQDALYVGTSAGVYYRNATMSDWEPFMTNLPNVIVNDLQIHYGSKKLRAATYGRGIWSSDLAVPSSAPAKLLNISTRLQIQSGDNGLFAGFIVTGPAGSTKKVLIRGIGPSLAQFGVPGTIPDPFLELHTGGAPVTNDNWQQAPNKNEIPTGFAPKDPRESIIIATLPPGNYSAILKGAHGETGVGLAEVYDLNPTSAAQLANIATRGLVQTGDNVLIGGFIVAGNEPAKILVRAIGPSLAAFGLQGVLADTELELHDSNGGVTGNDDWRSTQEAEIIATSIPPKHNKESAVLAVLAPGNYTAVVRGKNNTTGIAVVEAYNLQ
jgi:photosystem II stability/assembly factor-like uncharacterized protein